MRCKKVFLVGFMCSGKTTVGKSLAKTMGWNFVDVDQEVERSEGMTIEKIFSLKGEEYFRRREWQTLMEISKGEGIVISTGGGLGASPEAMEWMKERGLVVWLKVSFDTFLKRCGEDPKRPLLKRSTEEILRLFEDRSKVYSTAHLTLEGEKDCEVLVKDIMEACNGY
ncbi:MAG: shikimate kinase [Acidobacteria bacterium]|jgi:shikimate kinase|nr:MAG: shikimate kinase [Acidobacteriota bacterium]